MRDYQPKRSPYVMEKTVYARVLAIVRDYPRMCRARSDALEALPSAFLAGGKSGNRADPTAKKAGRIERLDTEIDAVHAALACIPREYHTGILDNIIYRVPMIRIEGACEKTWSRWKARFLWEVAVRLHLIDRGE